MKSQTTRPREIPNRRVVLFGWAESVHMQRLCEAMIARGYELHLVSLGGAPIDQVATTVVPRKGKFSYLVHSGKGAEVLARVRPAILHVNYGVGFGVWALRAGFSPMLLSLWGSDLEFFAKSPVRRIMGRKLFSRSSRIQVTSQYMEHLFLKYWADLRKKLIRIPMGVDLKDTVPFPSDDVLQICYAKQLLPIYGPDILLNALVELKKRGISFMCSLAGEGPLRPVLETIIRDNGLQNQVKLSGWIDRTKIPAFIGAHHVLAMPSRMESFGVAALEAASLGRSVVATRVGGIPEVVQDNQTGILVPPENPIALADALERLSRNPEMRIRMGEEAIQFVKQEYDATHCFDRVAQLYGELMNEERTR